MGSIITIQSLKKIIKQQVILDIPLLELERGQCHGFTGRNGSGKSMLFKCICGYVDFQGGILVNTLRIGKDCDFIYNAGVVIEQPDFLEELNAFENLKILININKKVSPKEISHTLEQVGLEQVGSKAVFKYSCGMKQRLRIAQAIIEHPEIVILDEPFNGLDEQGVSEIRSLLTSLKNEDTTILLTSHIREDIDLLCDNVYKLSHGKLI